MTRRYFAQRTSKGARVLVNRPKKGEDFLYQICKTEDYETAEKIADDLSLLDQVRKLVIPAVMP